MKRVFRQILGWGMMLTLPLMMTSCGELFDMLDNPITPALQVLRAQLTLKVGESKPIQASTQAHVVLLYSSDNPAVATVDATGLITAVSPGTARITIKAQGEDDYYRTEIFSENTTTVEVTVIPAKAAGSISFATASVPKYINDPKFTNALTTEGDGVVTYTSDNTTVAEVDATTGEVTIKGVGTANIKATTTETETYAYETNTAQYTLTVDPAINLASLTADYIAQNGDVLTGTLAGNYKICIADNANVELKDVTINGVDDEAYPWAGITCLGIANITITGINSVKGFYEDYPGIQAGPINTTLTISGTGSLTATGGGYAAGIGSGYNHASCGNITINGGTVNASSSNWGAGIGSGYLNSSCGAITISGGTVTASSSKHGAGIGSGHKNSSCGDITISGGTIVATSTKDGAGIGSGYKNSSCKNITISGGTVIASSGDAGAGIGSGYVSSFGSITITTGITQVQATRNYMDVWPIGKGFIDQGSIGAVTINGVTVTSNTWDGTGLTGLNFATSTTGEYNLTWTLTPKVP